MTKDKILVQLGLRIRTIRKEKGFTQDEAAHNAGLARSYYGDVERGTRNVSAINLVQIANALDAKVGDFFS